MARCAALYFGRASPRTKPLTSMAPDLGVLDCEALRERSEQLAIKYPEVGGSKRSRRKPFLRVICRAKFVHGVDEYAEMIRIDVGRDAMAEIEHMPRTRAITRQGIGNALANYFR